jgi:hypothetical protein
MMQYFKAIDLKNRLVVHTSGSISLDVLDESNRKGVFTHCKLLQNKPVDFLLFLFAAENATDFQLIDTVAKLISNKVLQLIHNAARCMLLFFVNNFTNHLYQIGNM